MKMNKLKSIPKKKNLTKKITFNFWNLNEVRDQVIKLAPNNTRACMIFWDLIIVKELVFLPQELAICCKVVVNFRIQLIDQDNNIT